MSSKSSTLDSTALRYFQAAAAFKSIRRAAESLHISASALSRQITLLETALEVSLFERLPRGLRLTSAGEILLLHVDESFRELQRGFEAINELKNLNRGHVRVALAESAMRGLLAPALSAFWAKHPNVELSLQVVGTFEVMRLLEQGEADLGLAFNVAADTNLPVVGSAMLQLGAVMSPRHPLASRRSLRLHDLIGVPVFLSDSSLMLHSALREARDALPLTVRAVTNSITAMSLLAAAENGVALKTIVGVNEQIERGEIQFVPVVDARLPRQRLAVVTRRALPLPALVNVLAGEFAAELERVSRLGLPLEDAPATAK
jgi:DNA-binding transcriptional LysR family regulator